MKYSSFAPVFGVFFGFLIDMWLKGGVLTMRAENAKIQSLSVAFISLHAKFAKADGKVTTSKIKAFRKCVNIPHSDEEAVGIIYDSARRNSRGFVFYIDEISKSCALSVEDVLFKEQVIESLYYVLTNSDNENVDVQLKMLNSCIEKFGVSPQCVERLNSQYNIYDNSSNHRNKNGGNLSKFHKVLEVKSNATKLEIKKAYKKMVRLYHPDKLIGEGATSQELKKAKIKMAQINEAYSELM